MSLEAEEDASTLWRYVFFWMRLILTIMMTKIISKILLDIIVENTIKYLFSLKMNYSREKYSRPTHRI